MKRIMPSILLVFVLMITTPITVVAEDHSIVWDFERVLECPVGNRISSYLSGYHSFTSKVFDTATIEHFNLTVKTTQPVDISVSVVEYGYGYNISYRQVTGRILDSGGTVTFNATDFGLDEWTGVPENYTWTGYYNRTHYYQTVQYYVRLPHFAIELLNTGTEQATIIWFMDYNLTLHGWRYFENVTYHPKSDDEGDLLPDEPEPTTTIYHWWVDWWPGTSNPIVDGFFLMWLNDQEFNNTEWFAFNYDPTQFFAVAFEKGFLLGIAVGMLGLFAILAFGKRFIA